MNDDKIVKGLKTFQGLEHRQEIIANHQNILFVNDSKGTNAGATAFCFKGLSRLSSVLDYRRTA